MTSAELSKALATLTQRAARPSAEALITGRPTALATRRARSAQQVRLVITVVGLLHAITEAEAAGVDVFAAVYFSEPILPELRSLANIPVISR